MSVTYLTSKNICEIYLICIDLFNFAFLSFAIEKLSKCPVVKGLTVLVILVLNLLVCSTILHVSNPDHFLLDCL